MIGRYTTGLPPHGSAVRHKYITFRSSGQEFGACPAAVLPGNHSGSDGTKPYVVLLVDNRT
jgi:hypothetical protein